MRNQVITLLAAALWCASSSAQESQILNTISPKLRAFLTEQPAALNELTNALTHTFSGKTVRLFYFYSNDESEPKAFHYYPNTIGMADVVICTRENQQPLDEFITILFEVVNARGESRFSQLVESARAGTVSKTEFARGILKAEFEASKATRDALRHLKVSKQDQAASYYYGRFTGCPNEFEEFLSYSKKISPLRDASKEYELKYDSLRKGQ